MNSRNKYKFRTIKCVGCEKTVAKRMPQGRLYCSLPCYRNSPRPKRKTGKIIKCKWCKKEAYKPKCQLKNKHHFCSGKCANSYSGRNKIEFVCKICGKKFKWSKSRITQANPLYCSWACRLKDKKHILTNSIKGNLIQQKKRGLNKLELRGREILKNIGLEFNEQILMFDKFLVDILLKNRKIVIQWDGEYWHTKPKRRKLDISQDAYLKKCGYKVLRITDRQIKNDIEKVYADIKKTIR